MQEWIARNGFGDDKAFLDYAVALANHYGKAIGALSCQMYEAIAEAQGVVVPSAEIADLPEYGEVAKVVYGAKKQSEAKVAGAVGRLVKQVGADTTLKNAKRDNAFFAWIGSGDSCAYCRMLSAVGWQKAGDKTIRGRHAEHIHAHCDCQYAIDFRGDLEIPGYNPERLQEEIMDIVDPNGEYYDRDSNYVFDDFINENGRSSKMHPKRIGLNALRRGKPINYNS